MSRSNTSPTAGAVRRAGVRAALALAPVLAATAAGAQGTLSGQGFGYPTGQLSTASLGAGGAMSEFDALSPINPAALAAIGTIGPFAGPRRPTFSFQYDPEFRQVSAGGTSQSATLTRFPVISASVPAGRRGAVGLSASTYLDRTFSTTYPVTAQIGSDRIDATERIESRGSVADVRLGGGYAVTSALRVGLAGHVFTGENRLVSSRVFADTASFGSVSDSSVIDYGGVAASAGFDLRIVRGLSVAGSYRRGGKLHTERADSTITRATAPDRMGAAVRFDRISGAAFGVSYARNRWSNLRGLGSAGLRVSDGTEVAAGAEIVGPRYAENVVLFRFGGRRRDLPFGVASADVRETAFAGGVGAPLAGGRALVDFALQHASRSARGGSAAVDGVSERAWTLSFGFTVRP